MTRFQRFNILGGWLSFAIAAIVYLLTLEPSASFWDCGEFIASAFKLEVGHPPGAPVFMLVGRFFSMFGGPEHAAFMMNAMSALASAFTILFLFWSITHLGFRWMEKNNQQVTTTQWWSVLVAGFIGSMVYTFSDTFWYSAVEAEVYASSSLFTAVVFWAILKWENVADSPHASRWLILIAYLMGLSIGVHLLNLLAIPAIVLVYYFKKYKVTPSGVLAALVLSAVILGSIMYLLIPGVATVASWFELLTVNGFGLPYNSGVLLFVVVLIGLLAWGLYRTQMQRKVLANTVLLVITVIMLGYSSYALIMIRSNANPPMDQNNPDNVFGLLYYLNREQYGDRPLVHGQYYNAPARKRVNTRAIYGKVNNRYDVVDHKAKLVYDERFTTVFPRMWSDNQQHVQDYERWVSIDGRKVGITGNDGQQKMLEVPSFADNLAFFFKYQVGHMYLRYFMWNFTGRQNDIQGHGNTMHGNWISGIPAIDNARLGDQAKLPDWIRHNQGRNVYFGLPLLLGLLGLWFHYRKDRKNFFVVLTLFILTGLAIVVYLNQYPHQPRERDYAFAGSFYAFAIWVGLGAIPIVNLLYRTIGKSGFIAGSVLLLGIPALMAQQNWDDHDRSGRYTTRDIARNYLDSCEPNSIIFTNGDNDTFPLWYAQEVEGYRTDVKVVNLSYLRAGWYIQQVSRKSYEAPKIPFSMNYNQYRRGTRDALVVSDRIQEPVELSKIMDFVKSENKATKAPSPFSQGKMVNYIPTRSVVLPVDTAKVAQQSWVDERYRNRLLDTLQWQLNRSMYLKDGMMILDLLDNNDWERPLYFAMTVPSNMYMNLDKYLKSVGFAYRLVPMKAQPSQGGMAEIDTKLMYDKLMNTFQWGGIEKRPIGLSQDHRRMYSNARSLYGQLAEKLMQEGKLSRAREVLDRGLEIFPHEKVPFDLTVLAYAEAYAGLKSETFVPVAKQLHKVSSSLINYYLASPDTQFNDWSMELRRNLYMLQALSVSAQENGYDELATELQKSFEQYYQAVLASGRVRA
ncbi:MAG: glycosyltransferase family 117 protein [Bacteroidota bacterium]